MFGMQAASATHVSEARSKDYELRVMDKEVKLKHAEAQQLQTDLSGLQNTLTAVRVCPLLAVRTLTFCAWQESEAKVSLGIISVPCHR